ncbi:substrate-binding domain-containing protein [Motiliproteus sp. MSK22-1]|uniref:substrate-binding domain-containing protein n=1 Tax=Motiliproteus sp. MSK22-1 TaxID=1897630 RepID=UPI000975A15E|nr:substrate-binding domain-containing protein [Motiliproteus sp. MSK22-1]OMH33615.1 hypothetical protein BGP75_11370 [Motiliproteus sp. MSK22-1]
MDEPPANRPLYQISATCVCLFISLLTIIAGCDRTPFDLNLKANDPLGNTSTEAQKTTRVALVMKTLTNPFFLEMERGARRAEREFAVDLIVKMAASETSIQQQIGIVEDLIRDQVDALVIAPGDSVELIPVLRKAQLAGIVVVNIDNQLDPFFSKKNGLAAVPFISVDNKAAAYRSAKYIADKIQFPAQAAIMGGIPEALNSDDRIEGALKAFRENPKISLLTVDSGHWKIEEGHDLMEQWLLRYPQLDLIFAANDMMALGAIEALREAGREDVLVSSFDALIPARQAIEQGTLQASVDQNPAVQGYLGVQYALRALNGEVLPEITYVDAELITASAGAAIKPLKSPGGDS